MAKPKPVDLREALIASSKGEQSTVRPSEPEAQAPEQRETPRRKPRQATKIRSDLSNVTGYYPKPVKKQLRMISAEEDRSIEYLLGEALNDFFAKRGKPEIVPLHLYEKKK